MPDAQDWLAGEGIQEVGLSCFVICPIGDEQAEVGSSERQIWEESIEVFSEIIEPSCSAHGIRPVRADQMARTGEIPEQVFVRLRDDDVVIADLTGGNPNVMYELGLRHTTGKLTIQLGERGRLPFDVAAIRTILFTRDQMGLIKARKNLTEMLSHGLNSGGDRVSATRIWLNESPNWARLDRSEPDDLESEEPGFLEKLVDLEEHIGSLAELINDVNNEMQSMTSLTRETVNKMESANKSGAPASARLVLADRLAENLKPRAEKLETIASAYELSVEKVDPGVRHILGAPQAGPNAEAIQSFRQTTRQSLESAEGFLNAINSLQGQLKSSGDATRSLRRVNGRIRMALARIATATNQLLSWRQLLE